MSPRLFQFLRSPPIKASFASRSNWTHGGSDRTLHQGVAGRSGAGASGTVVVDGAAIHADCWFPKMLVHPNGELGTLSTFPFTENSSSMDWCVGMTALIAAVQSSSCAAACCCCTCCWFTVCCKCCCVTCPAAGASLPFRTPFTIGTGCVGS